MRKKMIYYKCKINEEKNFMSNKELKALAEKIAKAQMRYDNSSGPERADAEKEILRLSNGVLSLVDLMRLDEMIQEILKQKN